MTKFSPESSSNYLTLQKEPFILATLGLILINFLDVAIYFCFLYIPLVFYLIRKNENLSDFNLYMILLFSFLYPLFLLINGIFVESVAVTFGYFIFPAIFYFLGKYLIYKYPNTTTIYFLVFFICFFFSVLPFLANLSSVYKDGFMQERNIHLFWTAKNQVQAATSIGSYFAINMALLPLIFSPKSGKTEKWLTAVAILLFAIALFSILNMSNRSGLLITVVSLVAFLFIPQKNRLQNSLAVIVFLIILSLLYIFDVGNIRTFFETSRIFSRISGTNINEEQSRFIIWGNALKAISGHIFGIPPNFRFHLGANYAHNLWLDVTLRAGILPLIPLLIFSVTLFVSIVRLAFNSKYETFLRVLITCVGIGFFTTFFLEPIMEGFFIMFLLFCFFFGITEGMKLYIK